MLRADADALCSENGLVVKMLLHEWRWAIAAIRLFVDGPASSLRWAEEERIRRQQQSVCGRLARCCAALCLSSQMASRVVWLRGRVEALQLSTPPLSLAKASGLQTGEMGAGSWELVRRGRHRERSWLAGGPRWLRWAAIRCDAMLSCAARGAAPSPAEQPGLSRAEAKRAVRSNEALVGPGDDWTACAMVEVGMVERAFSVPRCHWAGCWQGGRAAANGRGERDLAGSPAPCYCRRLAGTSYLECAPNS